MLDVIDNAINQSIEEAETLAVIGSGKQSLMDIFREKLPGWDKYLFPLWDTVNINRNEKIAEILRANGYPNINAGNVATYIYRVRLEKKSKGKVKE